jgi:hypothetical protein
VHVLEAVREAKGAGLDFHGQLAAAKKAGFRCDRWKALSSFIERANKQRSARQRPEEQFARA